MPCQTNVVTHFFVRMLPSASRFCISSGIRRWEHESFVRWACNFLGNEHKKFEKRENETNQWLERGSAIGLTQRNVMVQEGPTQTHNWVIHRHSIDDLCLIMDVPKKHYDLDKSIIAIDDPCLSRWRIDRYNRDFTLQTTQAIWKNSSVVILPVTSFQIRHRVARTFMVFQRKGCMTISING